MADHAPTLLAVPVGLPACGVESPVTVAEGGIDAAVVVEGAAVNLAHEPASKQSAVSLHMWLRWADRRRPMSPEAESPFLRVARPFPRPTFRHALH